MKELIDTVTEGYQATNEIKATALELSLPSNKVKMWLITCKVFYPETEQIQELLKQGKTMEDIQTIMELSYFAINIYLSYSKVIYS